jgi:hypothetical protein
MAAMAYQTEDGQENPEIRKLLQKKFEQLIEAHLCNPWCGLCKAPYSTFFYEDMPTIFATMEEARVFHGNGIWVSRYTGSYME